jgi:hypothetical protein
MTATAGRGAASTTASFDVGIGGGESHPMRIAETDDELDVSVAGRRAASRRH